MVDQIFAYQTLALPLLVLAVLAALELSRPTRPGTTLSWWILGVGSAVAVVVTHHVTALAMILLLGGIAIVYAMHRRFAPALFTLVCAAIGVVWALTVAHGTTAYLGGKLADAVTSIFSHTSALTVKSGTGTPPTWERLAAYSAVGLTLCLLALGLSRIWLGRRRLRFERTAMALAAVSYFGVLVVRVFAFNGSELAGRAFTFTLIPVSSVIAVALLTVRRNEMWVRAALVPACVAVLLVGGIVTGWPPWWERLPSSFRIASFDRGVDPQNTAAALWARTRLVPNNRVGGDFSAVGLMGTYGNQSPVRSVSSIFYAPRFRTADAAVVKALSIRYFIVDTRMTRELPAVGGYFGIDPVASRNPTLMPTRSLRKFDRIPKIDRVYDGGAMVLYDLSGSSYTG